jgi:hypothetical protein
LGAERRSLVFNITIEQAWDIYLKQNKRCALSGTLIVFSKPDEGRIQTASLDRIDSSKGYILENVQWVHKVLNKMKGKLSDNQFKFWCNLVTNGDNSVVELASNEAGK